MAKRDALKFPAEVLITMIDTDSGVVPAAARHIEDLDVDDDGEQVGVYRLTEVRRLRFSRTLERVSLAEEEAAKR